METIINWDGSISICLGSFSDYFVRGSVFNNEIDNVLFGSEFIKVKRKSYNRDSNRAKSVLIVNAKFKSLKTYLLLFRTLAPSIALRKKYRFQSIYLLSLKKFLTF